MVNKSFYNTILCQTFSPCGNYLVVGDIYGSISVFHLSKLINPETSLTKEEQLPKNSFVVKDNVQINSLLSTESFLVVGVVGEIYAYPWKNVKTSKNLNCIWSIEIPNVKDVLDKPDINCMYYNEENEVLYAGCGDNNIYAFKIENRKLVRTLSGHTDYVHCICPFGKELASGGEDGSVFIWDLRDGQIATKLEPHLNCKVERPELGKWIGAVGYNEDWLLCGGGPRLSLWHFRSMNLSTVFPIEDEGIHVAEMYKDKILAGGRSKFFYQMNFNGDIVAEVPTSAVTTYSVIHQEEPYKALCISGSSPHIDVCSNFVYKDLQLSVP